MADRQRLLELALKGLEADRARLDDEINELRQELSGQPRAAELRTSVAGAPKKRTMSAEARRKISESMKRRHAERKKAAKKQQA